MKKFTIFGLFVLFLLLVACAAPAPQHAPASEPEAPEPQLSCDALFDDATISLQVVSWQNKPFSAHSCNGLPLTDWAALYLEKHNEAWLAASREQPDNIFAIEGYKMPRAPELIQVNSADEEDFSFVCTVELVFKPLHYQHYTRTGGTGDYEEEGWLITPMSWEFGLTGGGELRLMSSGSDLYMGMKRYVPVGLIYEAQEIYGWFELDTMGLIDADEWWSQIEYEGNTYHPCRFATYAELAAYLRQYFSEDITGTLLARDIFAEIDGKLYVIHASRGAHIAYESERWYLAEDSPDKRVFIAEVDFLYPEEPEENRWTESFEYVLEREENGWVFTRFDFYL